MPDIHDKLIEIINSADYLPLDTEALYEVLFTNIDHSESPAEDYEDYLDALARVQGGRENSQSHASKYRNGKSNSLSGCNGSLKEAMDDLQSLATQVANIYGYNASKLNWHVRYEYDRDFNEIRVNFN